MSKERRAVTVDSDLDNYLSNQPNASAVVNDALRAYVESGGAETAMLELRRDQLRSELRSVESRAENIRDELDRVESRLEDVRDEKQSEYERRLSDAAEQIRVRNLDSDPGPVVDDDTERVRTMADQYDVDEADLRERALEEYDG